MSGDGGGGTFYICIRPNHCSGVTYGSLSTPHIFIKIEQITLEWNFTIFEQLLICFKNNFIRHVP